MKKVLFILFSLAILYASGCKKEEAKQDLTPPEITLLGASTIHLEFGENFIDSGYTATDDIDGDITAKVIVTGMVDTTKQGVYVLKYNVSDLAGNKAIEKIRKVIIHRSLSPQNIQNGFAINYTATWCNFCGGWGNLRINKYATEAPKGAIICAHLSGSDPMTTQLSSSFAYDRSYLGAIPSFYVGDDKTADEAAMVIFLASFTTSSCGIDYNYFMDDDSIYIEVMAKFFNGENGDFYLSILVLEDEIDGSYKAQKDYQQSGALDSHPNNDYTHDFVLRASSVSDSAYGELIVSNPILNQEIVKNYSIAKDSDWKNPYPICIVWKYIAGTKPEYHFVNALKRKN